MQPHNSGLAPIDKAVIKRNSIVAWGRALVEYFSGCTSNYVPTVRKMSSSIPNTIRLRRLSGAGQARQNYKAVVERPL